MAEEEVNYASVVFKNKKKSQREEKKEEETVYDDVRVRNETTEQTGETNAGNLPDKKEDHKRRHCRRLACCLGILCVILLSGIIAVGVYLTTISHERDQFKENQTSLLAVNLNLTNLNHNLRSENEKLRRDHHNLTLQVGNLTQNYHVLESKIANVTEENQELKAQNQELKAQKKNLTEKIQDMETKQNELNVSRAQWSIDAYCPRKNDNRQCNPCQEHWSHSESSCFAINNAQPNRWKTWDEAREDCKEKISDLAVIVNEEEKKFISDKKWERSGSNGYWIGLRAEDGKWKWVNGTDLTETSWIQQHPTDGHCAISVWNEGWKSVNCGKKNMWICGKAALSV